MTDDRPEVVRFIDLRDTCGACGSKRGRVEVLSTTLVARAPQAWCASCGAFQYELEPGEIEDASKGKQRRQIKPATRARILRRYQYACICCNRTDQPLHVAHIVPLAAAEVLGDGCDPAVLQHEMNLAPMCVDCNLGIGKSPVGIALLARLIAHWIKQPGIG